MGAPALTQYVQGQGSVSADNLNTFEQTCDTFADLSAFVGTTGMQVYARGQNAIGDGGQGVYYWNPNATSGDGFNTIMPAGSVIGGWTRLVKSPVNESASAIVVISSGVLTTLASITLPVTGFWIFTGHFGLNLPSGTAVTVWGAGFYQNGVNIANSNVGLGGNTSLQNGDFNYAIAGVMGSYTAGDVISVQASATFTGTSPNALGGVFGALLG